MLWADPGLCHFSVISDLFYMEFSHLLLCSCKVLNPEKSIRVQALDPKVLWAKLSVVMKNIDSEKMGKAFQNMLINQSVRRNYLV